MQAHGPADTDQTVSWLRLLWMPHELVCTSFQVVLGRNKIKALNKRVHHKVSGGQALKRRGLEGGDSVTSAH